MGTCGLLGELWEQRTRGSPFCALPLRSPGKQPCTYRGKIPVYLYTDIALPFARQIYPYFRLPAIYTLNTCAMCIER